jgi:ArsR family metal-binding transcriptional regulator
LTITKGGAIIGVKKGGDVAMDWIPVRMAAKILEVSTQRIYELISQGKLGWRKLEKTIQVSGLSVYARKEMIERGREWRN